MIADGEVEIERSGHSIATVHRGEGLGEVALLRTGRRTATATASTAVRAFRLNRDSFLTAVNGHVPTLQSATRHVRNIEVRDTPGDPPGP